MTTEVLYQSPTLTDNTDTSASPLDALSTAPDFEIFFEMSKAVQDKKDGRIWVSGIASDQSEDLDGEIIKAAAYPKSVEYLNKFGKFNWEHGGNIIGDITEAKFISPTEAKKKFGVDVKGRSVEVTGWVMPADANPEDKDLQQAHTMLKSGIKMGFSMQGVYGQQRLVKLKDGRTVPVSVPGFIHQVAICAQPKNSNSICFTKSLSKVLLGGGESDASIEPTHDWPVVICSNGVCEQISGQEISKALASDAVLADDGTTGGTALKLQDLSHGAKKKCQHKEKCLCGDDDSNNDDNDDAERLIVVALRNKKKLRALRKSFSTFINVLQKQVGDV